jgi:hypothetical protein
MVGTGVATGVATGVSGWVQPATRASIIQTMSMPARVKIFFIPE